MKTILVVDDNPANIGLLFACLTNEGFKTLVAQDGRSAIDMALRLTPDLILLDVIMPDMDGFDTCRALKKEQATADIPIFFMTALSDTESKVRGFGCGAVDFISKPFQQEEVLARIHTHLTIQDQRKRLLMANHIKEKVISVVAHDLKNPFTAIFGYLQMLSENYDQYDDIKRKDYIDKVRSANKDLFTMVENLLTWITTGEGQSEYDPKKIWIDNLVTSACNSTQALAEKKSITLARNISDDAWVNADENMLAAVVRNLLTNALKFTPKSGKVSVTAKRFNEKVILTVTDTGMGITPSQIDLIKTGKKSHSTMGTEKESGTGMGLMICLDFIQMMNGNLSIESTPGKGSCFKLSFPAIDPVNRPDDQDAILPGID